VTAGYLFSASNWNEISSQDTQTVCSYKFGSEGHIYTGKPEIQEKEEHESFM
jgi:hypothetical protein